MYSHESIDMLICYPLDSDLEAYFQVDTHIIPPSIHVTANFTTHCGSHIYGFPCPSADSLDPMDHFCTFDVSNIIPKNMHCFPYVTFKPIIAYIRGYDP